jgi:hypothetical protein
MDTADHPLCPMCDPSILPEGYTPIDPKAVIRRPDGSRVYLRGVGKCYLNGIDVTNATEGADPERGVIVAYHRVLGPAFISRREHAEGVRPGDKPRQMVRHLCNREGLDCFDPRLGVENGGHACRMMLTGEVFVLDPATGEAPVYAEPEDVGSEV